jgi:hypothetical protein
MARFKVVVTEVDVEGNHVEHTFDDGTFQLGGDGTLQVNCNGRSLFCWAPGYWAKVSMVPQDG